MNVLGTDPSRHEDPGVQVPTSLSPNTQINGVYSPLQGVQASDPLMGGYGYLQWSDAGGCWHEALDLNSMGGGDSDLGACVVTPLDGFVTFVGVWDGVSSGFGNHVAVWVDDERAAQPCYYHVAHLDRIDVHEGQEVAAGTQLGLCGKSGWQPYAHVHAALWWEVPPGGWDFWQLGYSKEWVAEHTLDLEAWIWESVTKAGEMTEGGDMASAMSDWQLTNYVLAQLYEWAGIPFNPEGGIPKTWVAALREGVYCGRPRTDDRPYGEPLEGWWSEFESRVLIYKADGTMSWNG